MATVTISAENLQLVYSQLNFLRNYVGLWSLDWNEYVVSTNDTPAHTHSHHPAKPVAAVTDVPEEVISTPVKKGYF